MKLTDSEKEIVESFINISDTHFDKLENDVRKFKWLCHNHLPQSGEGYTDNINVFEIQDKTIEDIKNAKKKARETLIKIIEES